MNLMINPVITDFQQDVNGDIKMLKLGENKEDAYANIIGQAEGADLDNNKTATINVSTYTEPVVINPTSGKDGMKKATITLSNIPSGGVTKLYAWGSNGYPSYWTTNEDGSGVALFINESNSTIDISDSFDPSLFERVSTYDITLS